MADGGLHGVGAALPINERIQKNQFGDFASLTSALPEVLQAKPTKGVLCAAAISDFSVDEITTASGPAFKVGQKLNSDQTLNLRLKRNPKLVLNLKDWSKQPGMKVIAFKLTHTNVLEDRARAVSRLLERPEIDFVVGNDLSEISPEKHSGAVFRKDSEMQKFDTKLEMANLLEEILR